MNAFITGGAGFIGSHLAEALLAAGHQVTVLDNLSTGAMENIEHLKAHPGFRYVIDSVTNEPVLAELIDGADVVFHLAAAVGVKLIVEAPVHTIETNVHGTEVVLKHANKKKKLVVIASTSEVYGKSTDVPFREDADLVMGPTTKHRWAYACSKAIDEFLALAYWKEKEAAGHHRALLQHRRPAPDRPLRHGHPQLRAAGAGRPADHRPRRRHADAQLLLRRRRRRGAASPGGRAARRRRGVQHRQRRRRSRSWRWPKRCANSPAADRRSSRSPTIRPTRPASRTCRGACPICAKISHLIGYAPEVGLDEILARVVDHFQKN